MHRLNFEGGIKKHLEMFANSPTEKNNRGGSAMCCALPLLMVQDPSIQRFIRQYD